MLLGWTFNRAFDQMPLVAVIDGMTFCVHGGIPRFLSQDPKANILNAIREIKRPLNGDHLDEVSQIAYDLLWSDPARQGTPPALFNGTDNFPTGFCESHRGLLACEWSPNMTNEFFRRTGVIKIVRAHQPPDVSAVVVLFLKIIKQKTAWNQT